MSKAESMRLQEVVMQLQNLVSRLQEDLTKTRKDNAEMRNECEVTRQDRSSLIDKLEEMSHELGRKMEVVDLQEQKIKQLSSTIEHS